MKETLIIIAHSGLEKKITREECEKALPEGSPSHRVFIDFDICVSKLGDLYDLPFEQLALEQQRRFKAELEPILMKYPNATVAYFGLVAIPLAVHLGYLCSNTNKYQLYQSHHGTNEWYLETEAIEDYNFEISDLDLPTKVEKGVGDVFIRVSTSYRIEPQHTYEVLTNPTNEFDLLLSNPNVDGITSVENMDNVMDSFQKILSAYANYLPDKDKIHLFCSSTTAVAFGVGTLINPNVFPYIQTYQYSKEESPKYREAILITKRSDDAVAYSDEDRKKAYEVRIAWNEQLKTGIKSFITTNEGVYSDWFDHITQKSVDLKGLAIGLWEKLPELAETSLKNDTFDLKATDINDGFSYDSKDLVWKIDDGMFVSLEKRISKIPGADILQAGRLFLFHEGLHFCSSGHNLIGLVAEGIGQFPKVIEEADYQADVYALLYDYKYSQTQDSELVDGNLKKFFSRAIETATETMWSFVDNGTELTEIQIRSMNRFLNWYWQSVRIESLDGRGTLAEIIEILFDKPIIEVAGPPPFILNERRVAIKLNSAATQRFELAIFHNNKIIRTSPTGIKSIIEGFRELNGEKIKDGLKSFLVSIS
ncbi:SAVED domain-containing protein [Winogradskyella sp.]|uniref:SAVED domain-containing protein n=1 Tax=Winogradskyella sp. TaxID=1883156 RepID=UPI003BACFFDF